MSTSVAVRAPNGAVIHTVADWHALAPPKAEDQWVEGRSAYELAYAWCGSGQPAVPLQVREVLDRLPDGPALTVDTAFPERQIRIDERAGEPPTADLAFIAMNGDRKVAVTVEAKADEPFGATVAHTMVAALERAVNCPRSQGLERVRDLARALFCPPQSRRRLASIGSLHYQLLTATAGSLAYAHEEGAGAAMLLVHEFRTNRTDDARHAVNDAALGLFIARLCGQSLPHAQPSPFVLGPLHVGPDEGRWNHIPFYIAKVSVDRRDATAER